MSDRFRFRPEFKKALHDAKVAYIKKQYNRTGYIVKEHYEIEKGIDVDLYMGAFPKKGSLSILAIRKITFTKSGPQNEFGTKSGPQNEFGTKSGPQNEFGTKSGPQNEFCTPSSRKMNFALQAGRKIYFVK